MKIRNVTFNNRKKEFEVTLYNGSQYSFPYVNAEPQPTPDDRIAQAFVDKELSKEAITYILDSGEEGSIHIDQILEYNDDPEYFAEIITYKLSLEARRKVDESHLSRRQLAKQLNTSVPQLYRLLDLENTRKSVNQLLKLLYILNLDVDIVVKEKAA